MTHTELAAATHTSATADTGVDISGITADWTVVVEVQVMTPGDAQIRLSLEDTVDNFTTPVAGPGVSMSGIVGTSYPKRYTFTKRDFPDLRFGTGSAKLRTNLTRITGTSPSVTYHAWIEY